MMHQQILQSKLQQVQRRQQELLVEQQSSKKTLTLLQSKQQELVRLQLKKNERQLQQLLLQIKHKQSQSNIIAWRAQPQDDAVKREVQKEEQTLVMLHQYLVKHHEQQQVLQEQIKHVALDIRSLTAAAQNGAQH